MIANIRRVLFIVTALTIIGAIIAEHWISRKRPDRGGVPVEAASVPDVEHMMLVIQGKITVQLWHWLSEQQNNQAHLAAALGSAKNDIQKSLAASLGKTGPGQFSRPGGRAAQSELILADYLDIDEARQPMCAKLSGDSQPQSPELEILKRLCTCTPAPAGQNAACNFEIAPGEEALIRNSLGWFGDLLLLKRGSSEQQQHASSRVFPAAEKTFRKFLRGAGAAVVVGLLSIAFFSHFLIRKMRGKAHSQYRSQGMPASYSMEIFALYLCAMYLIPRAIDWVAAKGLSFDRLALNAAGILAAACFLFWPLLWGQTPGSIFARIGLQLGSPQRFMTDLLIGPYAYIASIVWLFILLVLYAALLMALGVDPSQGTHPIIPLLAGSKSSWTVMLIIALATIVAPIVEEIMFRGALYSWLRERLNALGAVIVSSLIFAAIHPQGAIGILPLTIIGIVLALLREWRGNLTASMAAHACFNSGTLFLVLKLLR